MVGPKETSGKFYGASAFNWGKAGCSWCHPGGGPLEYDRQGYRLDDPTGFPDGNPATHPNALESTDVGTYADKNAYANAFKGDYFAFVSDTEGGSSGLVNAWSSAVIQRCSNSATTSCTTDANCDLGGGNTGICLNKPAGQVWDFGADFKRKDFETGGVMEADCMMCHFSNRFNNQMRNLANMSNSFGPKFSPTFGLADQADNELMGGAALVTIAENGQGGATSAMSTPGASWAWRGTGNLSIPTDSIVTKPRKENCSICHFADNAHPLVGPSDDMGAIPAGNGATSFGNTAFQKRAPMIDYDRWDYMNKYRKEAPPTQTMSFHKGRVELGKRSEMINMSAGSDVHMNPLGSTSGLGSGMECSDCHYNVEGEFDPIIDKDGHTIYPGLSVGKMDHQFAKGHNLPDGKNNDQLDETVTCESCHVTMDHKKLAKVGDKYFIGAKEAKKPAHAGLPSFHLDMIGCRTCHIPVVGGGAKKLTADFTTTQYPVDGIERGQGAKKATDTSGVYVLRTGSDGTKVKGFKPLLVWKPSRYDKSNYKIMPVATMLGMQWFDLNGTYYPKRFSKWAALFYQNDIQDGVYDGVANNTLAMGSTWNWTLNSPQNGDDAMQVNTTGEISAFVDILKTKVVAGARMGEPQMRFTFGLFDISHMVLPKKYALGANGCADCHSATGDFFTGQHRIFKQPNDGGMQMTCDNGDCSDTANKKRVYGVFKSDCEPSRLVQPADPVKVSIDLTAGRNHGDLIADTLDRSQVLCYSSERIAALTWQSFAPASSVPDIDGDDAPDNTTLMARLSATTAWDRNTANDVILQPLAIAVDATGSVCNDDLGEPTACTCAFTVPGVTADLTAVNAACKGIISTPAAAVYNVTVAVTRTSDGSVSTKTLQAAAVAASTKPSIATATVTDNGDCTADVDVTSTNASSLLVNCGNGKALVSANFSAGTATALCDYKDTDGVCIGTEAAIIAIAKDANGLASDSVTVDPEFNPQP